MPLELRQTFTFDDIQIVPRHSTIEHRADCNLSARLCKTIMLRKPFVSSPMDTITGSDMAHQMWLYGGIGIIHRFQSITDQVDAVASVWNADNNAATVAAIGITGDYLKRVEALVNETAVFAVLIDVAHGDHNNVRLAMEKVIKLIDPHGVDIIAGSVATSESTEHLCKWGASGIRVGIGNGALCETRIRTGVGIPQASALSDCVEVADKYDVPIIADGGIRYTGDAAKALALGAESVMLGSLLAATKETPGETVRIGISPNEQLFKKYRGSASLDSKRDRGEDEKNIEGNTKLVPFKGPVKRILDDLTDGIQSAMSYVGARNIEEFRAKSEFIQVTQSGIIEASPHLLR